MIKIYKYELQKNVVNLSFQTVVTQKFQGKYNLKFNTCRKQDNTDLKFLKYVHIIIDAQGKITAQGFLHNENILYMYL